MSTKSLKNLNEHWQGITLTSIHSSGNLCSECNSHSSTTSKPNNYAPPLHIKPITSLPKKNIWFISFSLYIPFFFILILLLVGYFIWLVPGFRLQYWWQAWTFSGNKRKMATSQVKKNLRFWLFWTDIQSYDVLTGTLSDFKANFIIHRMINRNIW